MAAGAAVVLIAGLAFSACAEDAGSELRLVAENLEFPEGPAWDGKGNLYVSNCQGKFITRVPAEGKVDLKWMSASEDGEPFTWKMTNGMTVYRDGSIFACDSERNVIIRMDPKTKKCEVYADSCEGQPFKGPNDLAFDPQGNLYFTDPVGSGRNNPVGAIYRVDGKTQKVSRVAEGLAFPNGLAFTADGKTLYLCESQYNRIVKFKVNPDGTLGQLEEFADLSPDGPGEPDGMAVDVKGNLWITHFGAHTVLVVNPKGEIIRTIPVPHTKNNGHGPTNIEFAGEDLKTVYITDPGSAALFMMKSDVAGLPLFCSPMAERAAQPAP